MRFYDSVCFCLWFAIPGVPCPACGRPLDNKRSVRVPANEGSRDGAGTAKLQSVFAESRGKTGGGNAGREREVSAGAGEKGGTALRQKTGWVRDKISRCKRQDRETKTKTRKKENMKLTYIGNGHHIDLTTVTGVRAMVEVPDLFGTGDVIAPARVIVDFGNGYTVFLSCVDFNEAERLAADLARQVNEACARVVEVRQTETLESARVGADG